MRSAFPGHFANKSKDIQLLWEECIFVLDANVLLSLYRFSDATRSELFQVFYSLQERLWIPNQVAQEYLENRLSVIADQVKTYDDSIKKVENIKKGLENQNIPPFVTPALLSKSETVFKSLLGEFDENRKLHEKRIHDDEIKDELELLFDGKVGAPFSRQEMEGIIEQEKQRYEERIPPGFSDAKKGGSLCYFKTGAGHMATM
ncbi:PIN-like domain-containing protein [Pseudomonas sp. NMS19W]|uniref:PIN-like domain-containing protein n=1 Tax=Pseudomonas sp. NMS19W TaxID=3079768 RepID=UPI003F65E92F